MRSKIALIIILVVLTTVVIKSTNQLRRVNVRRRIVSQLMKESPSERICTQLGIASWYGMHMRGKTTASGEKYNPNLLTAASREFPFGTELNVINLANERNVTVIVNDRGPYKNKRVIDLSVEAARELGMKKAGLTHVCVLEVKKDPDEK